MLRRALLAWTCLAAALTWPTTSRAGSTSPPHLVELLRYEAQLIREGARTQGSAFGSDPSAILNAQATGQTLVLLRNTSEILLLDPSFRLSDRKPAPRSPRGWTLVDDRYLFVAGELSRKIVLYELRPGELLPRAEFSVEAGAGFRGVAYVSSPESLFLIDPLRRTLTQLSLAPDWRDGNAAFRSREFPIGAGALQIQYAHGHLFLNLLLDHRIDIIPLTDGGPEFSAVRSISHNGPIWDFDVTRRRDRLLVAAVGVEDHPLDRTGGEFGYVDSFLFLYDLPATNPEDTSSRLHDAPERFAARNLSAENIVTPKSVRWEKSSKGLALWVLAFGSDRGAVFDLHGHDPVLKKTFQTPPGSTDFLIQRSAPGAELVTTNTLLDRIYRLSPHRDTPAQPVPLGPALRHSYPSTEARVGEILFFTTLLSPHNRAEGPLSRFTCETCHFEGTIDGRIHYTGRGRVFATTKTLRGLANNVPLFSRAGDRSLASMVVAEFRVANQRRRDNFSLEVDRYPWLKTVANVPDRLGPLDLRKSFLSFFVHFGHGPNPWLASGGQPTPAAVKGLAVFRARCEYCHLATRSTRNAHTVEFHEWRASIEDESTDLVWGAPFYIKTNILPYVSSKGARVPSLRRVSEKYPYFTNGSSRDLRAVLKRFRYRGAAAWHHHDEPGAENIERLTPEEIDLLEELLRYF